MIAPINGEIIHAYGNSNKTGFSDSNSTKKYIKLLMCFNRGQNNKGKLIKYLMSQYWEPGY